MMINSAPISIEKPDVSLPIQPILELLPDGIVVVDKQYQVVFANKLATMLLEQTEGYLGKNWADIVTVLYDDQVVTIDRQPLSYTIRNGRTFSFNLEDGLTFKTKSGRLYPVSLSLSPLEDQFALIVFRDVTEEKKEKDQFEAKADQQTREVLEGRARLLASINSLKLGFIITDDKLSILMMNNAALSLICGESGHTTACGLDDIAKMLEGNLDLKKHLRECISEKKSYDFKNIFFQNHYLHFFISPITAHQETIGAVLLIEDTTEAKIAERSKDEFFSIASHELRTPLTAIRGNTSMIQEYYGKALEDPSLKEMVTDIHDSSVRLIEIVNDFLDLSRLEQGKIQFKNEPFNVAMLVEEVINELQTEASDKKVFLKLSRPDSQGLDITADRNRVKQILINLVGNALKFTENGTITVELSHVGPKLKIAVIDTGKGISKENQILLFRKFQQASDNPLTRDTTQGTGLGLYISKLLAEGMGGTISLERSEVGVGSTFACLLPLQPIGQSSDTKKT